MESKAKVRFLYHRPIGERGVGKAIVALTWFYGLFYNWKVLKYNFSHEELWTPDEDGNFAKTYTANQVLAGGKNGWTYLVGQCFSSTTRGDANGVRFAPASDVLKHPERWKFIEVEVDAKRLEVALEEAKKLVGAKYDFLGILGFLQPIPIQDDKRWYCSEILDWFKFLCKIPNCWSKWTKTWFPYRHKRISPRRAAYILSRTWGEPKSL